MNFHELQKSVNSLNEIYASRTANGLHEKIRVCYGRYILAKLAAIIQDPDIKVLEQFLSDNWQLIKGNFLCYTACPKDKLTLLMCDLANYIISQLSDKTMLGLLMPGIPTESMRKGLEECRFVKKLGTEKIITDDEVRPSAELNNEDPIRKHLQGYFRKNHAILLYNDQLYTVKRNIESGYLEIKTIPKTTQYRLDYQQLKHDINSIPHLPVEIYKPIEQLFLHRGSEEFNPLTANGVTLIQSGDSYSVYGVRNKVWGSYLVESPIIKRLLSSAFRSNSDQNFLIKSDAFCNLFDTINRTYFMDYTESAASKHLAFINRVFNIPVYPNLQPNEIQSILATHILAGNYKHLIPVRLLSDLNLQNITEKMYAVYAEDEVTDAEMQRLIKHSTITQDFIQQRNEYCQMLSVSGELYTNISKLLQDFHDASVYGRGQEYSAHDDIYPKIIKFHEYYMSIDGDNIAIPSELKVQLQLIFALTGNKSAVGGVQTCLAVRRAALVKAMKEFGHELTPENFKINVEKKRQKVIKSRDQLNAVYTSGKVRGFVWTEDVSGRDDLGIRLKLLKTLDCNKILAVQDTVLIYQSELTIQKIIELLEPLHEIGRDFFLQNISEQLVGLVKSIADFYLVKSSLSNEQQKLIFNLTLLPNLENHVQSKSNFDVISEYLSEEERLDFLKKLKSRLPNVWADITYAKFITVVKKEVLKDIHAELKKLWLNKQRLSYQAELDINNLLGNLSEIGGLSNYLGGALSEEEQKQLMRERLERCAIDFEKSYRDNHIDDFFDKIMDIPSPGTALYALCERHTWIKRDPTSTLVKEFVQQELSKNILLSINNYFAQTFALEDPWNWFFEMRQRYLIKPPFNLQVLAVDVSAITYPYMVPNIYLQEELSGYPNYASSANPESWRQMQRLDLYRILAKNNKLPAMIPAHIDELVNFTADQWANLDVIFVNVADEDTPLWIMLKKDETTFIAHVPEFCNIDEFREKLGFEVISYKLDAPLNDIGALELNVQWQVMLLSMSGIYASAGYFSLILENSLIDRLLNTTKQQQLVQKINQNLYKFTTYEEFCDPKQVVRILKKLQENFWLITENQSQLILHHESSKIDLIDAFKLIYNHASICELQYTYGCSLADGRKLFDDDIYLYSVKSAINTELFQHATCCAARNRFLNQFVKKYQDLPRGLLWASSGAAMVGYYQQHSQAHADITQMGEMALSMMFLHLETEYVAKWDAHYKERAPKLRYELDTRGNLQVNNPANYIRTFANCLADYDPKNIGCAPLFQSLSLLLPAEMTEEFELALLDLIRDYGIFKKTHPEDPDEIILLQTVNLSANFFEKLQIMAEAGLEVLVRIPAWDQTPENPLNVNYHATQNTSLANQRKQRLPLLAQNVAKTFQPDIVPEILIATKLAVQEQTFVDEDVLYPLTNTVNLAQEQQQEQQQQQQHQQASEIKPIIVSVEETSPVIVDFYQGNEDVLIGRNTSMPDLENFVNRFSRWVGSMKNADEVIEKIEISALEKILKHEKQLQFGIQKDNLPAGFYLKRSRSTQGLILCFDAHKEIDDLQKNIIDPFKLRLTEPMPEVLLRGDERQYPEHMQLNAPTSATLQLFNHYGFEGVEHLQRINQMILNSFGEDNHQLWEKYYLQPIKNWAEVLEKDEMDAIALSIVTLSKAGDEATLWWQMLKAHGEVADAFRYADLWRAYQAILKYSEEHRLVLNLPAILKAIKQDGFNAPIFLDRLHKVLQCTEGQEGSQRAAQEILNSVDKIDWHHNGFYYACCYYKQRFWDADLKFTQLKSTIVNGIDYATPWGVAENIIDYPTHALRFACQRMQLSIVEYHKFKIAIQSISADPITLRVYCACLAIGVDNVETEAFSLDSLPKDSLAWLNGVFNLDGSGSLSPKQIFLHFKDIPRLLTTLEQNPELKARVLQLKGAEARLWVNACGRALQAPLNFDKLMRFLNDKEFTHPVFIDYPWLIDTFADNVELNEPIILTNRLRQQLQTIDFSKSTCLPSLDDLIAANGVDVEGRSLYIAEWVAKGCSIVDQDAPFRLLHQDECKVTSAVMERALPLTFKDYNLALCTRLLNNYVVIQQDRKKSVAEINALLTLLLELDNKVHYNELGQILGVLLAQASSTPPRLYSAAKLTACLAALCDKTRYATNHFPITLLEIVLNSTLSSSLLNTNLYALQDQDESTLIAQLTQIASSTLPIEAKQVLTQCIVSLSMEAALAIQTALIKLHTESVSREFLDAAYKFIPYIVKVAESERNAVLPLLLEAKQINLITLYQQQQLTFAQLQAIYPKFVGIAPCLRAPIDQEKLTLVLEKLSLWDPSELTSLMVYLNKAPRPDLFALALLLTDPSGVMRDNRQWLELDAASLTWHIGKRWLKNSSGVREQVAPVLPPSHQLPPLIYNNKKTQDLIHHFESVMQARDAQGFAKRHYSQTAEDHKGMLRVLTNMLRKDVGKFSLRELEQLINLFTYGNVFAEMAKLASISMQDLSLELQTARRQLNNSDTDFAIKQAKVRMLVCMREILLRKTGKWLNHTQLLTLIYAALQENENLLYQLRTGQGKSLITVIINAYLALNGKVEYVFSAKDSLSMRDHSEFVEVFTAMGVRSSYINAQTALADCSLSVNAQGIGAVNYATMGNLSLFLAHHIWAGKEQVQFDPKISGAFLDEADDILLDDDTQFNYSAAENDGSAYNLDEWVYRVTRDYYLQIKETFVRDGTTGQIFISKNQHLKGLCEFIQEHSICAPLGSTFLQHFIIPALEGIPSKIAARNQRLKNLLIACHKAEQLIEDVQFCIRPELRKIGSVELQTRAAKVIIANQIKEGATYSDGVQQFLHVRLNAEAIKKGESPNFFVDPVSQVVLSENSAYMINHMFATISGCTATPGDKREREYCAAHYGIDQIIQVPSHQETRSKILPTIYADSEDEQIRAILENMHAYPDRPYLILCKNDIAVKKLTTKLQQRLSSVNLLMDTNDSGQSESALLALAAKVGSITISARLSRGSEIQPETELGLMVIRTFAANSRITEQGLGRQGRNGARGVGIDILDYADLLQEFNDYLPTNQPRLMAIFNELSVHMEQKIDKYARKQQELPSEYTDKYIERHLVTRSVVQITEELAKEQKMFSQQKDDLLSALSGKVSDLLKYSRSISLRELWKNTLQKLTTAWDNAQPIKTQGDYNTKFIQQVQIIWQDACNSDEDGLLKENWLDNIQLEFQEKEHTARELKQARSLDGVSKQNEFLSQKTSSLSTQLKFNQWWGQNQALKYADDRVGLSLFNQALDKINELEDEVKKQNIYAMLNETLTTEAYYKADLTALSKVIVRLTNVTEDPQHDLYLKSFQYFFEQAWLKDANTPEVSRLLVLTMDIVTLQSEFAGFAETTDFMERFGRIMQSQFKDSWNDAFITKIKVLFASDPRVTTLLISSLNDTQLERCLKLLLVSNYDPQYLLAYLQQEIDSLADKTEIIPELFELALAGNQSTPLVEHLPTINAITEILPTNYVMFWQFLSQRTPVDKTAVDVLVSDLRTNSNLITSLLQIPKNISLNYIHQYLVALDHIPMAGQNFNKFLFYRKIIATEKQINPPLIEDDFNFFQIIYNAMHPEYALKVFSLLAEEQFKTVPLAVIKIILTEEHPVALTTLRDTCELAAKIQNLPTDIKAYLNANFNVTEISMLTPFVEALLEKNLALPPEAIHSLWQAWKLLHKEMDLRESLDVIQRAMELKAVNNWQYYFQNINQHAAERQALMRALHDGSLNLGADFKQQCLHEYREMIWKLRNVHNRKVLRQVMSENNVITRHLGTNLVDTSPKLWTPWFKHFRISSFAPIVFNDWYYPDAYKIIMDIKACKDSSGLVCLQKIQEYLNNNGPYHNVFKKKLNDLFLKVLRKVLFSTGLPSTGLYALINSQLDIYKAIKSPVPLYVQQAISELTLLTQATIPTIEKLAYSEKKTLRVINIEVLPYDIDVTIASFHGANADEKEHMRKIAKMIQMLPEESKQYLNSVFVASDLATLSNQHGSFANFVKFLNDYPMPMPIIAVETFWNKYKNHLEQDLMLPRKALLDAMELSSNFSNDLLWEAYFDDFSCKSSERASIGMYLEQGWINLGEEFKRKWDARYMQMAMKIHRNNSKSGQMIPLIKLVQEISHIVRQGNATSVTNSAPVKGLRLVDDIAAEKKLYRGSLFMKFSVSKARKEAVDAMFKSLEELNDTELPRKNYYEAIIEKLLTSQASIDRTALLRGYSRFYAVTQRLFVKIIQDGLQDSELSLQDKSIFYDLMDKKIKADFKAMKDALVNEIRSVFIIELTSKIESFLTKVRDLNVCETGFAEIQAIKTLLPRLPRKYNELRDSINAVCDLILENQQKPRSIIRT